MPTRRASPSIGALCLYTRDDAAAALDLFRPVACETPVEAAPGIYAELLSAGHIAGSASADVTVDGGILGASSSAAMSDGRTIRSCIPGDAVVGRRHRRRVHLRQPRPRASRRGARADG